MKNVLVSCLLAISALNGNAQPLNMAEGAPMTCVPLQYYYNGDKGSVPPVRRTPALLPSVTYDESQVLISTPYPIEDGVTIVIRSTSDAIIYSSTVAISDTYSIGITEEDFNDMHSIEIIYGSSHLIGYFLISE